MKATYTLYTITLLCGMLVSINAQSYTSIILGNAEDVHPITEKACVLHGGQQEQDNAMRWFLKRSGGGDIVVLATSGVDRDYNSYLYKELGVTVNSVETITLNSLLGVYQPYVLNQVRNAEAIWIVDGNQWNYYAFWNETPMDTLLNEMMMQHNMPIGGSGGGMAILGEVFHTAQFGHVTSGGALQNPYNDYATLSKDTFLFSPLLNDVITDAHYNNPDRKGRQVVFMARMMKDYNILPRGIGCDENITVCIDKDGIARVYGQENGSGNAYFIQPNCAIPNVPESCNDGQPLTWDRGHEAIKTYMIKGTSAGDGTFNLQDWRTGSNGQWQNWYVDNGQLKVNENGTMPSCGVINNVKEESVLQVNIFPNPVTASIHMEMIGNNQSYQVTMLNGLGVTMSDEQNNTSTWSKDIADWPMGIYTLHIIQAQNHTVKPFIKL